MRVHARSPHPKRIDSEYTSGYPGGVRSREKKAAPTTVRLYPSLNKKVRALADLHTQGQSGVINDALTEYFRTPANCAQCQHLSIQMQGKGWVCALSKTRMTEIHNTKPTHCPLDVE